MHGSLPTKLRVLRAERGLTLRDAERLTGVDKDTLSKIERGRRHPHDVTLAKIAEGYGVPVSELLEEPARAAPKAEAPDQGRIATKTLDEWLNKHGARRILMSDEAVLANCERMAAGSDSEAIPDRFEQEARETFNEELEVLDALRMERHRGGELFPKSRPLRLRREEYRR